MSKGLLLVISGPSGTGKGRICNELFKDEGIVFSISLTTRKPREGEVDGVNYHFVTKEKFEQMIDNDGLLEYAKVFENFYGTPRELVLDELNKGKNVILEIDVQGAMQVKKAYTEAVLIFILPPSLKELKERIVGRGSETEESLNIRCGEALNEICYAKEYNYTVVNDQIEKAVDEVKAIIRAEHLKVDADIEKVIDRYKEEV